MWLASERDLIVVALSAVLLICFLTGFFWLNDFAQLLGILGIASVSGNDLVIASLGGFQISMSLTSLRVFLAAGAVFFEFIIIIQAMFDRVLDSLRALIRPLVMLVPIYIFVSNAYETFEPVVRSLLPPELGGANPNYIAAAASNETLANNVFITFLAMLLYLFLSSILGGGTAAEVRNLRAELKKCQDKQRGR